MRLTIEQISKVMAAGDVLRINSLHNANVGQLEQFLTNADMTPKVIVARALKTLYEHAESLKQVEVKIA